MEGWLGLMINRGKTRVVALATGEALDFLGYTFRYERDQQGAGVPHFYLVERCRLGRRSVAAGKRCGS